MTTSVIVDVPEDVAWSAEVTSIERKVGGEIQTAWINTVKSGESLRFHVHDRTSIVVAEYGGPDDGHVGLVGVFAFALGQPISLVGSDERGTVIARAEYRESSRNYLVRYRAADGRLTEAWWSEAAIAAAGAPGATPNPAADAGTEAPALQA